MVSVTFNQKNRPKRPNLFSEFNQKHVLESRQRKVETTGMHLVKEVAKVSILSVPGNARQFRWMGYTMSLNHFCTCILISTLQFRGGRGKHQASQLEQCKRLVAGAPIWIHVLPSLLGFKSPTAQRCVLPFSSPVDLL